MFSLALTRLETRPIDENSSSTPGLLTAKALKYLAIYKAFALTTPIFLNPGTRIFHYIPHYIIPRMLYIPLQTNAWCDALSDYQYIAMFCPQRID